NRFSLGGHHIPLRPELHRSAAFSTRTILLADRLGRKVIPIGRRSHDVRAVVILKIPGAAINVRVSVTQDDELDVLGLQLELLESGDDRVIGPPQEIRIEQNNPGWSGNHPSKGFLLTYVVQVIEDLGRLDHGAIDYAPKTHTGFPGLLIAHAEQVGRFSP